MKHTLTASLAAVSLAIAGCASIMGTPHHNLPIQSTPSDATVSIVDEEGVEVFKGMTPTSVVLPKSTGSYWGGKDYKVTIAKPGFATQTIPVQSTPSGWYILGNLVFGGFIGWFVVDPFSGNMYTLSPDTVALSLGQDAPVSHNNSTTDGSIRIMLLEDVPAGLRDKLARLN